MQWTQPPSGGFFIFRLRAVFIFRLQAFFAFRLQAFISRYRNRRVSPAQPWRSWREWLCTASTKALTCSGGVNWLMP